MMKDPAMNAMDASIIYRMLYLRVLPELQLMQKEHTHVTRGLLAKCILYHLTLSFPEQPEVVGLIGSWIRDDKNWGPILLENLKLIVSW